MNIHDALADVALLIASRRQAASLKGLEKEENLWLYLRALSHFIHATGQAYCFEDFLAGRAPTERLHVSTRLSAHKGALARLAVDLLLKVLNEPPESEQKQYVSVLIALLEFVAETGQLDAVEDFSIHYQEDAPMALAHFTSHEEAEAWLRGSAELPSPAYILIGDEYYQFWYTREDKRRGMCREYVTYPAMESLTARGIPPRTPLFATRAEAEEWLMSHPAKPYTFVVIAGEHYFAVYHRTLKRHSIRHPASALDAWEERKRFVEHEKGVEDAP